MAFETALSYWFVLLIAIAGIELVSGHCRERILARRRWPANLALILIAAGLAAIVPVSSVAVAVWALTHGYGALNALEIPWMVGFVLAILLLSLRDYLVHLACHKVPVLWRFHKIHHSDTHLDVTTAFRVHPLMYLFLAFFNGGVVLVLGLGPEAVFVHAVITLLFELSQHTALVLPERIDRVLRPYLMTPALHHIHHSDFHRETASNYGIDFAFWDRLFGTYCERCVRPAAEFRYGLKQFPEERAESLDALLLAPFRKDPFS